LLARRLEDRAARGDFDAPSLTPIDRSQLQSVTNPGYSPAWIAGAQRRAGIM